MIPTYTPPQLSAPNAAGQRAAILAVDDQPSNIQLLYAILGDDYDVAMATNGEDALRLCEAHQPDLILLDIQMPGLSGFEVCERLKERAATHNIPIIFVTAQTTANEETRALRGGAVDFIAKPIDPEQMIGKLRQWLGRGAASGAPPPAPSVSLDGLPHDIAVDPEIDAAGTLYRIGGDVRLYRELLSEFVRRSDDVAATLATLAAAGEGPASARLAHALKGEAGNLGLRKLAQMAATVETELQAAAEGWSAAAATAVTDLRSELLALAARLDHALRAGEAGPAESAMPSGARANRPLTAVARQQAALLLHELETLLASQRMRALAVAAQLATLLDGSAEADAFEPLNAQIQRLQFKEAHARLQDFLGSFAAAQANATRTEDAVTPATLPPEKPRG